ncbi:hypothetical protein PF008_g4917 [Phytophthora fragariae]|uniref:Uncharacterized protein n=1 Tax=Phytophthora fragariae TaxID=53985 RepID=A0A6G0SBR0_9STRA|nr:hypothetical protein PF008_g4917 [Phytophthora fragariae]
MLVTNHTFSWLCSSLTVMNWITSGCGFENTSLSEPSYCSRGLLVRLTVALLSR